MNKNQMSRLEVFLVVLLMYMGLLTYIFYRSWSVSKNVNTTCPKCASCNNPTINV